MRDRGKIPHELILFTRKAWDVGAILFLPLPIDVYARVESTMEKCKMLTVVSTLHGSLRDGAGRLVGDGLCLLPGACGVDCIERVSPGHTRSKSNEIMSWERTQERGHGTYQMKQRLRCRVHIQNKQHMSSEERKNRNGGTLTEGKAVGRAGGGSHNKRYEQRKMSVINITIDVR